MGPTAQLLAESMAHHIAGTTIGSASERDAARQAAQSFLFNRGEKPDDEITKALSVLRKCSRDPRNQRIGFSRTS